MEKVYFEWEDRIEARHLDADTKEHDKNLFLNILLVLTAIATLLWMESPFKWLAIFMMFLVFWIKNV